MTITTDIIINKMTLFLVISCVLWLISTYVGLRFIRIKIEAKFHTSNFYYNLSNLKKEQIKLDRDSYKERVKEIRSEHRQKTEPLSEKMIKNYSYQTTTFFLGIMVFVIWHILVILDKNNLF